MELTAHISSAQSTPSRNATNSVASDFEVASEDTNMSLNSDVDVGEVDFLVEPMNVDVSLPVTDENVNSTDRVTYNWTPCELLSETKAAWITVMQVLDEARTPTEYQRKLINVINSRILSHIDQGPFANDTFQSPDTYRRMVQGSTSTTVKHNICPNGCYLFGSDDSTTMACPVPACKAPCYFNQAKSDAAREDIERNSAMPIPDLAPTRQIIHLGRQGFNRTKAHQVLINCLVMNIYPEHRTKDENIIQITVCPGKPKNLISFLKSVVEEVQAMYDNKLVIKKEGVELFRGRVAILGVTGDIPGISELMMAAGHTVTFRCRICKVKDNKPHGVSNKGKYYPKMGPLCTLEKLKNGDPAHGMPDVPKLFTDLKTLTSLYFFFWRRIIHAGSWFGPHGIQVVRPQN
ncbi:hypothetical protein A0J61_11024 [Choanephora cucurbitarum]|uniref:Uncharacterized protein n=1 Tax=Choanephora cucurbitarum TaxID=101091 RepID=A0A1C7MVW6_9FUNG|nr:hypothetical protein A0J61_11024 [Choanephora cucurbitarum]